MNEPSSVEKKLFPGLITPEMQRTDWLKAARVDAEAVIKALDQLATEPYAQEIIEMIVVRQPHLGFREHSRLSQFEWWPSVLEQAARRATETQPALVFSFFQLLADKPYATELLQKAAAGCADRGLVMALEYAASYITRPEAEKILKDSAERFPTQAIYFFPNYQTHPQALDILRAAAQAEPTSALVHANRFAHLPQAVEILRQAEASDPRGADRFKDRYEQYLK